MIKSKQAWETVRTVFVVIIIPTMLYWGKWSLSAEEQLQINSINQHMQDTYVTKQENQDLVRIINADNEQAVEIGNQQSHDIQQMQIRLERLEVLINKENLDR